MAIRSLFSALQYTSDAIVVPCCMNSTISTPFLSSPTKQLPSANWHIDNVCLNFSASLVNVCASAALTAL
jgi:hypothetical protein